MKRIMTAESTASVPTFSVPRRSWSRRLAAAAAAFGAFVLPLVAISPAQAATRDVHVSYVKTDAQGYTQYDVRFNGTVKPNGATGYIIDGEFDASCGSGTLTSQSAAFYYGGVGSSWEYKSFWCDDLPKHLTITGTRKSGEAVEFQVGATSGIANTYQYGTKVAYDIGTS